ncbi:ABC1 family-domain-containing protein [Schizophyllum commune]
MRCFGPARSVWRQSVGVDLSYSSHRLQHTSRRCVSTEAPAAQQHRTRRRLLYSGSALVLAGGAYLAYENYKPFRHSVLAVVRSSRIAGAAAAGIVDYKWTFSRTYASEEEEREAYSQCHTRSADRVLRALQANGGIFIKLGQHLGSSLFLPLEWTRAMRPLQDQCEPASLEAIEGVFISETGQRFDEVFDNFDPEPIGVASLAQVHKAHHRASGVDVAVKLQLPMVQEFSTIDINTTEASLGWITYWFPDFEFMWLADEMRKNLPREMDFVQEAKNAERAAEDFKDLRTSLYIPKNILVTKRVLVMEFIKGGRVDDLDYLSQQNIDRNKVAVELSRIFSRMVFINGWFHADPHPGNLLIRAAPPSSKSPYNFEIVLLDHGLYFDLDRDLRINYSHLWLSLASPATPQVAAERRKYAELVGNIGPDLYPVFEAALTGRAMMDDTMNPIDENEKQSTVRRASGMLDMSSQTDEEIEMIRSAMVTREGLLFSVLDVLRRVPRRILMVLKLNDLTRGLDYALATTHSGIRIFLVSTKCCVYAIWQDEVQHLGYGKGFSPLGVLTKYIGTWWHYGKLYSTLSLMEWYLDSQARLIILKDWIRGLLRTRRLAGAHQAAAGLM